MASKKEKNQTQDVIQTPDPFLRDEEGNPIGTAVLSDEEAAEVLRQTSGRNPGTDPLISESSAPKVDDEFQIFTDEGGGKGVKIGGRVFLGINENEIQQIIDAENKKRQSLGKQKIEEAQARAEEFQRADKALAEQARAQAQSAGGRPQTQGLEQDEERSFLDDLLFGTSLRQQAEAQGAGLAAEPIGIGLAAGAFGRVAAKEGLKKISKKLTIPLVVLGTTFFNNIMDDLTQGGATERQGAVNTFGQMAGDVVEDVEKGFKTPSRANSDLDFLLSEIEKEEQKLQEKLIAKTFLKVTGQISDVRADLADAKNLVRIAKNDVFSVQVTEPDAIEMAEFIERRKNFYGIEDSTIEEDFKEISKGFEGGIFHDLLG